MTNISKRQLSGKELDKLILQLNTTVAQLDKSGTNDFLHDLLGVEEIIMIAKRFAIIIMLTENYSTYGIAKKLKVSTSTVESIRSKHEKGNYDRLLSILCKDSKNYISIWKTLDNILSFGGIMPKYVGLERYRGIK